jgi:hypothetical protein
MMNNAIETRHEGDLVIRTFYDDSGIGDPREVDNLSVIVAKHRHYDLGDREPDSTEEAALNRGGWKLLRRYLRTCRKALAACKIGMYDHSGITIYPVDDDGNGHYAFDAAGWDSGIVGFAYITLDRWRNLMGDTDPHEIVDSTRQLGMRADFPVREECVWKALHDEIREYDTYLRGDVYGYVITRKHDPTCDDDDCSHDEVIDSCQGFLGHEYFEEEVKAAIKAAAGADNIGHCDVCGAPHDNGSQLDHCAECGNCFAHCACKAEGEA